MWVIGVALAIVVCGYFESSIKVGDLLAAKVDTQAKSFVRCNQLNAVYPSIKIPVYRRDFNSNESRGSLRIFSSENFFVLAWAQRNRKWDAQKKHPRRATSFGWSHRSFWIQNYCPIQRSEKQSWIPIKVHTAPRAQLRCLTKVRKITRKRTRKKTSTKQLLHCWNCAIELEKRFQQLIIC